MKKVQWGNYSRKSEKSCKNMSMITFLQHLPVAPCNTAFIRMHVLHAAHATANDKHQHGSGIENTPRVGMATQGASPPKSGWEKYQTEAASKSYTLLLIISKHTEMDCIYVWPFRQPCSYTCSGVTDTRASIAPGLIKSHTQTCDVHYNDGLVTDCSNSIANALELLQSCTESLILFINRIFG